MSDVRDVVVIRSCCRSNEGGLPDPRCTAHEDGSAGMQSTEEGGELWLAADEPAPLAAGASAVVRHDPFEVSSS
jgi:hypothetical protein